LTSASGSTRVYLIESTMGDWDAETIRSRLLEDPVTFCIHLFHID